MQLSGAAAVRSALTRILETRSEAILLGESVGRAGGVAGTSQGLLERWGPDRVIDLPIADRAGLAFALGLALGGKRPIFELAGTGRLPAVAEVLAEAAEKGLPLVVRVPYGTEAPGLDRTVGDLLPDGITVVCGSEPGQLAGLLEAAVAGSGPVLVLEPRAVYAEQGSIVEGPVTLEARTVREGAHVTLAAWGEGVALAERAADELAGEGVSAEVLDLVRLAPLPAEALGASVRKTGRLVVVHPGDGGLADRVRQIGLDGAFLYLEAPLSAAKQDAAEISRAARAAIQY